ncbi:MBL fold metallo-hydrolase [Archangium sp.]|uniref:MBL fold metallo-hydrolase n=1 Tax=Archangium sp. TaxID=1872627 RepID=UPI002D46DFFC|nr:MBL fold metallo-hydrolase [Archangium sp.]HYO51607.1 MBL fold metallo-hydrolase [Archangium sp.]
MAETDTDKDRKEELAAAPSMEPVQGTVEVDIPIEVLWAFFSRADLWPRWNECFLWAKNRDLKWGHQLIWAFHPIRWWYPYYMPAMAKIVELEPQGPARKVTWEVTVLPGFYARHTYHLEDLGNGRTRFGSYEKAMGWSFHLMKAFWIAHFTFVKDRSLEGAKALEPIYRQTGKLDETTVPGNTGRVVRGLAMPMATSLVLGAAGAGTWFYASFMRQDVVELASGVRLVMGGGGNTLVVEGSREAMLVDTKFPPGANLLRAWVSENVRKPVKHVVSTHYHYDHTLGNDLYPDAALIAHQAVPDLMRGNEAHMVKKHPRGVANVLVGNEPMRLDLGEREVILFHPGNAAHTRGDLCVYLPREKILMTGDLFFFTYYPFFDLRRGGANLEGLIQSVRKLAADHPDAMVVPGHGPVARSSDLARYADYLQFLHDHATEGLQKGISEEQAAEQLDQEISKWGLSILPSFHDNQLTWATARSNVQDVYSLVRQAQGN